ncbi:unnamed protein product [Caenorhabditis auriculariae]|uniref:Uncharacterized protein n=1 Tax=Caenorhabditis auriculariae TaxID=2777116 RepID=A0A8S1GTS7_9PELO|nr:unnamed protein product [Caenorhabditis auriculariae]
MENLIENFERLYGVKPQLKVRCPGRVNLIGEHIDYHGYSVLPMATTVSTTVLAARNSENCLKIANVDEKYKSATIELPSAWNGASPPQWHDYVLCGWKGVIEKMNYESVGIFLLFAGDIPESSGLSSSSSIVCASALVTLAIHEPQKDIFDVWSREQLAEICAKSEQYVGTQGGGMDQAAEVLAKEGSALKINFNPLSCERISLPESAVFVVAHSGATLNKAATSQFNERVVEGRIVAKLLLKYFDCDCSSLRLKDVQKACDISFEEALKTVETFPETVSREDVVEAIGEENLQKCLSANTQNMRTFSIRSRGRHVFSEARRVEQFAEACRSNDIDAMGKLMSESHISCSKDYECSCSELDDLTKKYVDGGAVGARLTGAGWGGCIVALFKSSTFIDFDYLSPLFVSKPSSGIQVQRLQ